MQSHDDNIERLVRQLEHKASEATSKRIRQEVFEAARERQRRLSEVRAASRGLRVWVLFRRVAVAAVLVAAVLAAVHFCWDRPLSKECEIAMIDQLYHDNDVPGLLAAVGAASYEGKLRASEYLAEIDARAREQLEKTSAALKGEAGINPFIIAIEYVRQRLSTENSDPVDDGDCRDN